MTQNVRITAIL